MVRGTFWISTILAAATATILPRQMLLAQTPAPTASPQTTPPTTPATTAPSKAIEQAVSVLSDPRATVDQRDDAAHRLIARRTDARTAIYDILANGRIPQSQIAVARALADDPDPMPDSQLIDPLEAMLAGPPQSGEAAAQALGSYKNNERVLGELIGFAKSDPSSLKRHAAIFGLGPMIDKSAAYTLMLILSDSHEDEQFRSSAAHALAVLSGRPRIGDDVQGWEGWWASQRNKPPDKFKSDLLIARANELDALQRHYSDLEIDLASTLDNEYRSTAEAERPERLMSYLTATNPVRREEGARLVGQEKFDGHPVPAAAQAQLRQMIGDSDPRVRLAVAGAINVLNDRDSLDPLLAQLAQEDDPNVKAALAAALGSIGDIKAVGPLLALLNKRAVVAAAAADSLQKLGPSLAKAPAPLVREAASRLRAVLPGTGDPATRQLRESIVKAMAELHEPSLLDSFLNVLNDDSPKIRAAALHGIGNIGANANANPADRIRPLLKDPDPGVRLEAVGALGSIDAKEYAPQLIALLEPGADDPNIQLKAWTAVQGILPELSTGQLETFADKFTDRDPEKRVIILRVKSDKELAEHKADEWADTQLNLGETRLYKLFQYDDAAANFLAAMTEKAKSHKPDDVVMLRLIDYRMRALLRSGKYSDAMQFAADSINKDPGQRDNMGSLIKEEAERLQKQGNENVAMLDGALKLIDAAKKLNPPLPNMYQEMLDHIDTEIRSRLAGNKNSGAATPGTSSDATARTPE